jgi:hypothetical protein
MAFNHSSQGKKLRTARHKESKRRYRARQREYVESLEQRLSDSRDQQVAGIKEVQLAAQKVVDDNSRLRALLRFTGVDDTIVESWLRGIETPANLLPSGGDAFSRSKPTTLRNVCTMVQTSSPSAAKMRGRFPLGLPKHVMISRTYHHLMVYILQLPRYPLTKVPRTSRTHQV